MPVDPFTAMQAGGSILSGIAGIGAGRSAAKDAKKDASTRRAIALQSYSPVGINLPGGGGVSFGGTAQPGGPGGTAAPGQPFGFDPVSGIHFDGQGRPIEGGLSQIQGARGLKQSDIGQVNASAGTAQDAIFNQLSPINQQQASMVGQAQGSNPFVDQSFANFLNAGQAGGNTLDLLSQGAGGAFGQAQQGLSQQFNNPFAQGLQQQLLGQAGNAFGALPGTQEQARGQTLDLLRQQAQPFEERAFSNLQDNLFSTGRMGTTGGGLQTEAFARGLGQADLSRQLQAGQEGRNAQAAQLNLGQGLGNQATSFAGMQDSLLNSATNRFGAVSNLAGNLQSQRFNQALTGLQQSTAPQLLQQGVQQGALQNLGAGLGLQQGITGEARNNAQLAQQFMSNQAAARQGAVGISNPVDTSQADMFAQLSGALAPQGGAVNAFANMFGGRGQPNTSFGPTSNTLGTGQDFYRPIFD